MVLRRSLLLLVLAVGAMCWAHPSFLGYTGIYYTPTAEVLPPNVWSAGAYSVDLDDTFPDRYSFGYGFDGRLEVTLLKYKPKNGQDETFLAGKYQIFPERQGQPAFAVGVYDVTDEQKTTVYIVASKTLSGPFEVKRRKVFQAIGHFGIGGGQLDGIFSGLELVLGPSLSLLGEYDTKNFNVGARILINDSIALNGALFDFDKLGIGISYRRTF